MKKSSLIVAGIMLGSIYSQAADLGIFEFNSGSLCGTIDMHVSAQPGSATFSALTQSINPQCEDNSLEYLSNSWKQGAEDASLYYLTFNITADPANEIDVTSVSFDVRRAATGPQTGKVYASVDGGEYVLQGAAFSVGTTSANENIPITLNTLSGGNIVFKLTFYDAANSGVPAKVWIDNIKLEGTAPLPVELIDFKAHLTNNKEVLLQWITASETNNDFFAVQRSINGLMFETVTEVAGAGSSSIQNNYEVLDREPLSGFSYYHLKQVDYDGKYEYSNMITIENQDDNKLNISEVYPNPTSTTFSIRGTFELPAAIELYDITGMRVYRQVIIVNRQQVDVRHLSKGIYMWSVGEARGKLVLE